MFPLRRLLRLASKATYLLLLGPFYFPWLITYLLVAYQRNLSVYEAGRSITL
jgi:hypothetical protein